MSAGVYTALVLLILSATITAQAEEVPSPVVGNGEAVRGLGGSGDKEVVTISFHFNCNQSMCVTFDFVALQA